MSRSSKQDAEPRIKASIPPVAGRDASPSNARPVDLVHLSRQTMGHAGLEREVLGLLARQIELYRPMLHPAGGAELQRVAHALKGASLNVGAFRLARAAESLERDPEHAGALRAFKAEMETASAFITDLLRPDGGGR